MVLSQTATTNRPLRVAYVLKRYPRFSETFVVNEILAHERAGVEVLIFALRPTTDTHFQPGIARVRAPVTYLHYGSVRSGDFWNALQPQLRGRTERLARLVDAADCEGIDVFQSLTLAQMLQDRGVDHLHAHFATSATTVARLTSLLTGIPYSFTAHAKDIYHEYVNPIAMEQKLQDASAVVTVSDFNQRYLERQFGCPEGRIHRIYNGLPLDNFAFKVPVNRPPLILGIGRLVEKKGFDDLIAACRLLRDRNIDFRCEIIGDGELGPALWRQIEQVGVESHVRLRGALPTDQVAEALHSASVLAVPCVTASTGDRDGLPTVLLEAMALGTPCVATTVTGIPEIVRDGLTGVLAPERNPEQLAAALQKVLADESLRVRLARSARELIEREFDIDRNTARMRALFCQRQMMQTPRRQLAEAV